MSTPVRIQRQRTKGWKMPEGVVYVGRGTRWGNPYRISKHWPAARCVEAYREEWTAYLDKDPSAREILNRNLGGKDLACWCALDHPCHADVLLELANAKEAT